MHVEAPGLEVGFPEYFASELGVPVSRRFEKTSRAAHHSDQSSGPKRNG